MFLLSIFYYKLKTIFIIDKVIKCGMRKCCDTEIVFPSTAQKTDSLLLADHVLVDDNLSNYKLHLWNTYTYITLALRYTTDLVPT